METDSNDPLALVPAILRPALQARGFTQLTPVQTAVLSSEHAGKDLRISSQTGSGKTVAMGLLLHDQLERVETKERLSRPRALIITPTRELTMQVANELGWLLRDVKARVISVTGGTSVRGEQLQLSHGAEVVVGTPGRLLDHLRHGAIDPSAVHAVVLDEADQMLDLGFRDELEAILEKMPGERRTHLVSATFSSEVLQLARRYQKDAIHIQGTSLGSANVDITHIIHLVRTQQTLDAVINLLLYAPDELTLIFVRTRADAGDLAQSLTGLGFSAAALTGEMEQAARTRVMTAFRAGHIRTLVATDVAARGIDVPDVTRVIQADPPKDAEVYTHRSGRTGRAGRKGTSIMLVPPQARDRVSRLLQRARIPFEVAPVPGAKEILDASDDRLIKELSVALPAEGDGAWNPHLHALAEKLLTSIEPVALVHKLLARVGHRGPCAPRSLETIAVPAPRVRAPGEAPPPRREAPSGGWVTFRFSSGSRYGADARRLLATVCRRGKIKGHQVGAIKIGTVNSTFDVAADVAERFAHEASRPDPREPKVVIEPLRGPQSVQRAEEPPPPVLPPPPPPPSTEKRVHHEKKPEERAYAKKPHFDEKPYAKKPHTEDKPYAKKPHSDDKPYAKKPYSDDKPYAKKPHSDEKPYAKKPHTDEKPYAKKPHTDEKPYAKKPHSEDKPYAKKPHTDEKPQGKPFKKPFGKPFNKDKPGKGPVPVDGGSRRPQRKTK